jgi:hypothetical protein
VISSGGTVGAEASGSRISFETGGLCFFCKFQFEAVHHGPHGTRQMAGRADSAGRESLAWEPHGRATGPERGAASGPPRLVEGIACAACARHNPVRQSDRA